MADAAPMPEVEKPPVSYLMVHNIPKTYRACDLRNFFSQIVETSGFRCFHYRHRPEVQKVVEKTPAGAENTAEAVSGAKCRHGETCCALVMVRNERLEELLAHYDKAFWVTREGETLSSRCHLRKVAIADNDMTRSSGLYLPPIEDRQRHSRAVITQSDLRQMIELRPPTALPAGNVGTPTSYILRQINACNFPAPLISRLGIEFPRMRAKGVYGNVPMDYGTSNARHPRVTGPGEETSEAKNTDRVNSAGDGVKSSRNDSSSISGGVNLSTAQAASGTSADLSTDVFKKPEPIARPSKRPEGTRLVRPRRPAPDLSGIPSAEEVPTFVRTHKGHLISGLTEEKNVQDHGPKDRSASGRSKGLRPDRADEGAGHQQEAEVEEDSSSDDAEEWDRHESLHNDVTSQERTKERLFEEEQEVVWEKGGSGLVFYTDAQLWDEAEGDFDAKTSDDWDIDTSVYYGEGAGDKDAKDFVSMEHFKRLREGTSKDDDNRVGYFEKFTRGFGRRILEGQGWSEGRGVGKSKEGPSEPIESEGQHPRDRSGFGYRGEKLDRCSTERRSKRDRTADDWSAAFSSVYDERFGAGEDPGRHDRNARSQEPTLLKYRKVFVKTSSATESIDVGKPDGS